MTIASGGVLPRIHPELLAKKRGTKGKSETILSPPPEKRGRKAASGKKGGKKSKAAKPRTSKKVSLGCLCEPGTLREQEKVERLEDEHVASIANGLGTLRAGRKWQRAPKTRALITKQGLLEVSKPKAWVVFTLPGASTAPINILSERR